MDWQQVAPDFDPEDGSLRDIYVTGTDLSDWQLILDALRTRDFAPCLLLGGRPASLPDDVGEIFAEARKQGALLKVNVFDVVAHCHFFEIETIEFDIDAGEVAGPTQLEAIETFMRLLGQATNKPVVLTPENMPEAAILRYSPPAESVEWVAPSAS